MAIKPKADWQDQLEQVKNETQDYLANKNAGPSFAPTGIHTAIGIRKPMAIFSRGGDEYERIFAVAENVVKTLNEGENFNGNLHVLRIMKEDYGLHYSSIVFAYKRGGIVTHHVLLIEVTGDYPMTDQRDVLRRTPAQALDKIYMKVVDSVVSEALKVNEEDVFSVDGMLVPTNFKGIDEEATKLLISVSLDAVYAEAVILVDGYRGETISGMLGSGIDGLKSRYHINIEFNGHGHVRMDQSGMPVRQDVAITLSTKAQSRRTNTINQGGEGEEILTVFGYTDFEYQDPELQRGHYDPRYEQPAPYMPKFVITHIESQKYIMTPSLLLLAYMSVISINEDMGWAKTYAFQSPAKKSDGVNYNNIGMLNILANNENNKTGFGEPFDQHAAKSGATALTLFLNTTVSNSLLVAIDVPQCGPDTWFTGVLRHIASGSKGAKARLNDAIENLIDGPFDDKGIPMFFEESNKIQGGYYLEGNEMRDLREINSLLGIAAYVHSTNQSPQIIRRYVHSLQNTAVPVDYRASEVEEILMEATSGRAVIKQYYERLTFNGPFLEELLHAASNAGFTPINGSPRMGDDVFTSRGLSYSGAGLSPQARVTGRTDLYSGYNSGYSRYSRRYR